MAQGCIMTLIQGHISKVKVGSGRGRVVKLFACEARGPEFYSQPRHLNFRDWLSPASKSRYGWNNAEAMQIINTCTTIPGQGH